ncbi:hypothetical protein EXIGLDRAFT_766785 [Exidia glandulosa HHB12029]|uniref:Protein kinase domain-containing protein n=1 Tax=Exidia glandulosa HHB12029 TaxID=1314781 RepID=A0A165JF53_EXIGL|nr:hypothetical protein EXIGLDRAFT_766785 [Exidia glandulosa HHB12029]
MPDEHFLDVLTLSESGRRALIERLLHWRATAQPPNLVGKTLELGPRFVSADIEGKKRAPRRHDFVQCHQPHCHHFDWPSLRPVPPSFTQYHTAVRIGKALQAGANYHSQVYVASFDLDENSTAGNEVVIKIYQPSLTPCVPELEKLCDKPERWEPLLSCCEEEWAYRQMVPLQGGFVPHAYGFYHVILPNAEPAIAFIMEKIDAVPSDTIAESVHNRYGDDKNEALKAVWSGVLAAGHAIQTCNLMTTDERNYYKDVLWPRDSFTQPGPSFPVLIDFGMAAPLRPGYHAQAVLRAVKVLDSLQFEYDIIRDWLQSLIEPVPGGEGKLEGSEIFKLLDVPDQSAQYWPRWLQGWLVERL